MNERSKPTDSIHPRGIIPPYMLEHMEASETAPPDPTQEEMERSGEGDQQLSIDLGNRARASARIDDVTHWQEADCDTKHTLDKSEGEIS